MLKASIVLASPYIASFNPEAPQTSPPIDLVGEVNLQPSMFNMQMAGAIQLVDGAIQYNPTFDDFVTIQFIVEPSTTYQLEVDPISVGVDTVVQMSVSDGAVIFLTELFSANAPEDLAYREFAFTTHINTSQVRFGVGTSGTNPWEFKPLRIRKVS